MFTGIVEEIGTVVDAGDGTLLVAAERTREGTRLGDSIAVDGVDLTVAGMSGFEMAFNVMPETYRCTNLEGRYAGSRVNLERSVRAEDRLSGHIVRGVVEGTGKLESLRRDGSAVIATYSAPPHLLSSTILRGAICVDGVSLTVMEKTATTFSVSLVEFTQAHSTLLLRPIGASVNIETDVVMRYLSQLLEARGVLSPITPDGRVGPGDGGGLASSRARAKVVPATRTACESSGRNQDQRREGTLQPSPRYEIIGRGYARFRREDPRLRARIHTSLGDARSVVNVGAGAGSYEPTDRYVLAIEPSDVMAAQRPDALAPAIRASAGTLPLRDASVDAAMAILTLHHWDEDRERGVRELRRVARDRVVILTYDARVSSKMWLMSEYLPEVADLDRAILPTPELIASWLGGTVAIEAIPVPRDSSDWMLGSYWAHPERVLDREARAATSGFARMPVAVVDRVVEALARDLNDGSWDARHGALRQLDELDVGLRLVVADGS